MLAAGGNAFDAAVAAAFALAVVEPSMSGLGGRLQALYRTAGGDVQGVDATTVVPERYTPTKERYRYGYETIGIPGVVAGLLQLHETGGALPLETVMAPAIQYAREGFPSFLAKPKGMPWWKSNWLNLRELDSIF